MVVCVVLGGTFTLDVLRTYLLILLFSINRFFSMCVHVLAAKSCDVQFAASLAINGTFASPGFPESYPDDVTCRYRFTGHHGDRVQLHFTAFNLAHSTSFSNSRKTALLE